MIKNFLRKTLIALRIDLTQNLKYDRLTNQILRKVLNENSNSIDVGAHKGEIIDEILKTAKKGKVQAFEAIPSFALALRAKFGEDSRVVIHEAALSDAAGTTTFNYVKNAPAYSGMKQRTYAVENPDIEKLTVKMSRLDDYGFENIDLIKIDVEGAEMHVLNGAKETIRKSKPVVLFEFGIGGSDHYGTTSDDIFNYFQEMEMGIYTLEDFLKNKKPLTREQLSSAYHDRTDYYFVAR